METQQTSEELRGAAEKTDPGDLSFINFSTKQFPSSVVERWAVRLYSDLNYLQRNSHKPDEMPSKRIDLAKIDGKVDATKRILEDLGLKTILDSVSAKILVDKKFPVATPRVK